MAHAFCGLKMLELHASENAFLIVFVYISCKWSAWYPSRPRLKSFEVIWSQYPRVTPHSSIRISHQWIFFFFGPFQPESPKNISSWENRAGFALSDSDFPHQTNPSHPGFANLGKVPEHFEAARPLTLCCLEGLSKARWRRFPKRWNDEPGRRVLFFSVQLSPVCVWYFC